jgi:hypothetical protein
MVVLYFILVFVIIVASLLCFKKQFDNTKKRETYVESTCSYKNSFDFIPHRSTELQDESKLSADTIVISSREFNIDGPTVFKGETDFSESEVSFNNVAFNNDIYVHKDVGMEFTSDLNLNSVTNTKLLKKYKDINDILTTENSVGIWNDNGDFEIEEILLETMSFPSKECLQPRDNKMVRVNDKDMCVYKMWKTIREGREPLDNSICDCCCPDDVVQDIYSEVRLIFVGGQSSLLYRVTPGNSLNITIHPSWEINGLVLRKSDDSINSTFKAFNGNTEKVSFDSSQFDNNKTVTVKPFKNLNSYIPSVIYIFVTHKNHADETKVYAIPGSKKENSFKPNIIHPGKSNITKWEVIRVPNTTNKFYLKSLYNNEYAYFKNEEDGRFNGHTVWKSIWRFEWLTSPGLTGKFHLIHDRSDKILFMKDNLDLRFMNYRDERKGEINTVWWYESDEPGIEDSRTFPKHRFTLEISQ